MIISVQKFLPFFIVFFILAIFDRIRNTFLNGKTKPTKETYYKWTFIVLFLSYLLIVFSSVRELLLYVKGINLWISFIGLIIYGCGTILRKKAINDLGDNWSCHIEIKEEHELVTCGIYKFLKHPYCFAVLFELTGLSLIANAFYSLILVFAIQAPLLLLRVFLEEKVLTSHFGIVYKSNK